VPLREAIARKFKRENNLDYKPSQTIVWHRRQARDLQRAARNPEPRRRGHHPRRPTGCYPEMVVLCGGKPVFVDCTMEHNFKLQPEPLERAITPKTKWIILNSPSNPTGAAYSRPR
jgi:aspartate aminotransferase